MTEDSDTTAPDVGLVTKFGDVSTEAGMLSLAVVVIVTIVPEIVKNVPDTVKDIFPVVVPSDIGAAKDVDDVIGSPESDGVAITLSSDGVAMAIDVPDVLIEVPESVEEISSVVTFSVVSVAGYREGVVSPEDSEAGAVVAVTELGLKSE